MREPYKIVLWGIGKIYNSHITILKMWESLDEIEVVAVTANELPNIHTIDGWAVASKEELSNIEFDYILVMNEVYQSAIIEDIVRLGIERKCILPYRIMDIPYFKWDKYIGLLESNLSIITNNCWGGLVCHTLGMECRSPFKNLALSADDLLNLLSDLRGNLSVEPKFVEFRTERHSGIRYPVMKLNDSYIHFNHDTSVEEALEKWNRRLKKINYDNIFVAIYTTDEAVINRFISLESNRKACFVPKGCKIQNPYVYELDMLPGQKEFWETVNSNVTNGANSYLIDIISLLLGEKRYRVN